MARQPTYAGALRSALRALTTNEPADGAAVRLAAGYAAQLDKDPECLPKVGPLLLATLTALGMTPAGRAAVTGKGVDRGSTGANPLDELRDRRRRRAEVVDSAAR